MTTKTRVYLSYSHQDRQIADGLARHFASHTDDIEFFSDAAILVGEDWHRQINDAIQKADAVVLLISPAFLGSQYIASSELPILLGQKETLIFPVLARPVSFDRHDLHGFEKHQIFSPRGLALSQLIGAKREVAYAEIVNTIRERLRKSVSHSRLPSEIPQAFADQVARLLELMERQAKTTSESQHDDRFVFVISSFAESMEPIFEGISSAANRAGLIAKRVKDVPGDYQITPKIMTMIASAQFVVADLTLERPNVYFELGYARGLGKTIITCAREGTNIHFDAKDWPYIPYSDSRVLEKALYDRFIYELERDA